MMIYLFYNLQKNGIRRMVKHGIQKSKTSLLMGRREYCTVYTDEAESRRRLGHGSKLEQETEGVV
jgi:hypothetical protein